jgi:hypothetical protein
MAARQTCAQRALSSLRFEYQDGLHRENLAGVASNPRSTMKRRKSGSQWTPRWRGQSRANPSRYSLLAGNIQGISSTLASVIRICYQNGDYNQSFTSKFPTQQNRELIEPFRELNRRIREVSCQIREGCSLGGKGHQRYSPQPLRWSERLRVGGVAIRTLADRSPPKSTGSP